MSAAPSIDLSAIPESQRAAVLAVLGNGTRCRKPTGGWSI
jgi:hypothetical protein